MNKGVIYKYPINIGGVTVIEVPVRSQFLSVKEQNDEIVAYFLLNAEINEFEGLTSHRFYTVGTGHNFTLDRGMEFLDSIMMHGGKFVLHIFKY